MANKANAQTAVPARIHGLDIVFNADDLYEHRGIKSPIFVWPNSGYSGLIHGSYAEGAEITATPEQEQRLRQAFAAIEAAEIRFETTTLQVAHVFNGMTPQEAMEKIRTDKEAQWDSQNQAWVKKMQARAGEFILTGGYFGGTEYDHLHVLVGAELTKARGRRLVVRSVETGEVRSVGNHHEHFISPELAAWFQEVAKIALAQPIPTELPDSYLGGSPSGLYTDYYGAPSNVEFPEMPRHEPYGHQDGLQSVRVVFAEEPRVYIKTRYLAYIVGGEMPASGQISLRARDYGAIALDTKRMRQVKVSARYANVIWGDASFTINVKHHVNGDQRIFPVLAQVRTEIGTGYGGFKYEWGDHCPHEIPARAGAAKDMAHQWAQELAQS